MSVCAGYRLRLRVRTRIGLTTDATSLSITIAGREVTIKSQILDQPLSETTWIVFGARGFSTLSEAKAFGEQLRIMVEVSALCSRLGADVGEDMATSDMSETFARSIGLLQPDERITPNIHGIEVLPDDDKNRIFVLEIRGKTTADPDQLLGALTELSTEIPLSMSAAAPSVRILNLALMNPQPLAQIALAFSAVEALGQDEKWSSAQVDLLENLAAEIETQADEHDVERLEIAAAIRRNLHRLGLRQGVMRVLERLGLKHLQKEWDRLYGLRSGVFHGTSRLTESEIHTLAWQTVTLCSKVVFALIERDGIKLPSVASMHFGGADDLTNSPSSRAR